MIPLFKPSCSELEIEAVTKVLESGWWGLGPKTEELEDEFAKFSGTRYAVATNSATTALEIVLTALGVGRNTSVILPSLTFASTALAVQRVNSLPVFADVNEDTLCIDWQDVERLTLRTLTRAVIPVWYAGAVQSIPKLDVPIIEDCAHAAGSENAGVFGRAACWSFHAVKNIAAGDGGMITTNSAQIANNAKTLRWCGIDRSTWERDKATGYGWNYNILPGGQKAHMNDITAALALVQLQRLPELNHKRTMIASEYYGSLEDLDWLKLPLWRQSSWHMFVVRTSYRDELIRHLLANGVSAGVHYKPLHHYEVFPPALLPVTDRVWKTLVTLPLYPDMTEQEIDTVIKAVRSFKIGRA